MSKHRAKFPSSIARDSVVVPGQTKTKPFYRIRQGRRLQLTIVLVVVIVIAVVVVVVVVSTNTVGRYHVTVDPLCGNSGVSARRGAFCVRRRRRRRGRERRARARGAYVCATKD